MKTLSFKNNDTIPMLGLGTWKSEPGDVYQAVIDAVKAGYRHIDCAPIYGNEREIGLALDHLFSAGIVHRHELFITSKLWNNMHRADQVLPAIKSTLTDLRLDYLDLYLIHWPVALKTGIVFPEKGEDILPPDELPLSETWLGMEQAVKHRLARHIGVSNFSIEKLKKLMKGANLKPELNQIELHPYLQQEKMLHWCRENGVLLTAYAPLGSRDRHPSMKGDNEPSLLENPIINEVANKHGMTPAQVLINWAIARGTIVIPKSVHKERIIENLKAIDFELTADEMLKIEQLDRHFRYVSGSFWYIKDAPYTSDSLWDEK
jgi:alcohol dehydrogenase (NADP+)